jgi:hypothetical protein
MNAARIGSLVLGTVRRSGAFAEPTTWAVPSPDGRMAYPHVLFSA